MATTPSKDTHDPLAGAGGAIHRLVRSLSGSKSSRAPTAATSAAATQNNAMDPVVEINETGPPNSADIYEDAPQPDEQAGGEQDVLTAKQRFNNFLEKIKNINLLKSSFSKSSAEFPPQHWNTYIPSRAFPNANTPVSTTPPIPDNGGQGGEVPQESDPLPTPTILARRIRTLIASLPTPTTPSKPDTKPRAPPRRRADGRPIPPAGSTPPLKDEGLVSMLWSATVMNGRGDSGRPSVWSVLEGIGRPTHKKPNDDENSEGEEGRGEAEDEDYGDDRSVMMYSPLVPTKADSVELADSELIPIPGPPAGDESAQSASNTVWNRWPFTRKPSDKCDELPQEGSRESKEDRPRPRTTRMMTQRVWRPSTTKISLQALWWGYRIYLPPPILLILSDKQLEAAKRAALITTALTWFFSHLPISSFPMPLQPALILLQRLIPFVGYIGTFISWSWSSIKSYDKGFGVILSATWILPVALLPGTWEERDFPKAEPVPDVTPTPPVQPPTKESPSGAIPNPPPSPQLPSQPATQPDPPAQIPPGNLPSFDTPISPPLPSADTAEAKARELPTQDGDKTRGKEKGKGKGFLRLR